LGEAAAGPTDHLTRTSLEGSILVIYINDLEHVTNATQPNRKKPGRHLQIARQIKGLGQKSPIFVPLSINRDGPEQLVAGTGAIAGYFL
jgi:hypothetical protein